MVFVYHIVRGTLDAQIVSGRMQSRSKYGAKRRRRVNKELTKLSWLKLFKFCYAAEFYYIYYGRMSCWHAGVCLSSTYDISIIVKEGSKVPRRGSIAKRDVLPDPLYNFKTRNSSYQQHYFDGKGRCSENCLVHSILLLKRDGKQPQGFERAMENVMPVLEVKGSSCRRCYLSGTYGGSSWKTPDTQSHWISYLFKELWQKNNEGKDLQENPWYHKQCRRCFQKREHS